MKQIDIQSTPKAEGIAKSDSLERIVRPFRVYDLTSRVETTYHETRESADKWVQHVWEWQPNSRPVVEPND